VILSGVVLVGDYMDPKERDTPLNRNRTSDENKSILWTIKGGGGQTTERDCIERAYGIWVASWISDEKKHIIYLSG